MAWAASARVGGGAWGEVRGWWRVGRGVVSAGLPVGLSVRGKEAFLVVAAAVGVDEGYETVEAGVVRGEGE